MTTRDPLEQTGREWTAEDQPDPGLGIGEAARQAAGNASRRARGSDAGHVLRSGCWSPAWSSLILGALGFVYAYSTTTIPDPTRTSRPRPRYVYYSDGKTGLGRFAEQNRESIPLAEMPAVDAGRGRSPPRTAPSTPTAASTRRASCARRSTTPRAASTQGASTITQQYVKILYLTQERTLTRKVKEAFLVAEAAAGAVQGARSSRATSTPSTSVAAPTASRPRRRRTSASRAKELTVPQGAMLAAVLNSPQLPRPGPRARRPRRACSSATSYVLDGMVAMGTLDAAEADKLRRQAARASQGSSGQQPVRRPAGLHADDGQGRAAPARLRRRRDRRRRPAGHDHLHQARR